MVSEQFDSGRMPIQNELSQSEEWESNEDLEYVDTKLEKIQEHFGSINKYLQTIMKKLDQLLKSQDDNLKKMSPDDLNSDRGRKAVIQNDRSDIGRKTDPSSDLYPNPYPTMNPKSYSDLNQKLDTNSESGIAMDEEAIATEIRGNKSVRCNNPDLIEKEKSGEDLEKDNRREITDKRIEVSSNQNLGPPHLISPLPISQPSPPSRSSSLPTMVCPSWPTLWSHSLLSSLNPSDNVTKTVEKMSITGSGKLFRNGRVQKLSKPILAILSRPKTNLGNLLDSDVLMWPKLYSEFLIWHKPRINLMRPFNFVTYVVVRFTMNSLDGVSDDLRKLPQPQPRPRPPPLPWPPPALTPLPPPALALNRRDLEELVKLLSQKLSYKLEGELDLLYVGGAAIVEPNQRGDVHVDSVVGFINPRRMKMERINEQRMFIKDSGAADNFILEGLVSKIKLPTKGIKIVGKFLPIKLEKLYLILAMQRIHTLKKKGTVDKNESRCAAALVDGISEKVWASRFVYNLDPVVRTKMYPNSERKTEVEA